MAWQFRIDRGNRFTGIVAGDPQAVMRNGAPQPGMVGSYGDAVVAVRCRRVGTR
ncbi:hypothetical protein [Sphingomonas oryzagri]|uniref:Uncharacterized protein n=1 Tax=Sphingomonas oryzagri TaxID=3042314 RepID=A0ABT6MYB5_9SPHN|nr:hypothetical protein [Sphingomonas oryzagri]MDH7637932.1 hypothetical protein [Sphingomonas oryzagri]